MRVTCIALAAVALALAKPHRVPGLVSPNTDSTNSAYDTTYALSAETRTLTTSTSTPTTPATFTASNGVIDFTPLPSPGDGDGEGDTELRTIGTALLPRNDSTRCVTMKRTYREARLVVSGCTPSSAQAFALVNGEIRTVADLCVTAPDRRDNAVRPVSLEPCSGSVSQQWAATEAGEFRGYRGKCLTAVAGLQRRQGTPLAVRGCMGRLDQQWAQRAVTARRAPADSIRLDAAAVSVAAGTSSRINAVALDADGHELGDALITWASADPSVAAVSNSGMVTGVGGGSTTIVAMAQGRVKSVAVEVRGTQYAGAEGGTVTHGVEQK